MGVDRYDFCESDEFYGIPPLVFVVVMIILLVGAAYFAYMGMMSGLKCVDVQRELLVIMDEEGCFSMNGTDAYVQAFRQRALCG